MKADFTVFEITITDTKNGEKLCFAFLGHPAYQDRLNTFSIIILGRLKSKFIFIKLKAHFNSA